MKPNSPAAGWRERVASALSLLSIGEPWSEWVLIAMTVVLTYGVYLNSAT